MEKSGCWAVVPHLRGYLRYSSMDSGGSCVVPLLNVRKDLQCVNSWGILPLKLSLQKLCKFINCGLNNMCFYHITYRYVGSSDAAWMTNVSCTSDQACISKCITESPIPAQTCPPDQYISIKCGKCKVKSTTYSVCWSYICYRSRFK